MLAQNIETFILTSLRFLLPHLQHLVIYMAACAIVCVNELELRGQDETQSATIHKDWDAVFACKKGWTGGDGGGTVDLGNDRVLWMFADSFIGRIENGKHAPGSHMVNKVFAVQSFKDRNRPLQKEFDFALGPEAKNGKPSAWLVPDPKVVKRARYLKENKYPYGWYWPTGGGCLVEVDGKRRLVVFLFHVASNGKQGIWGFENIGCAMAVIDNPERSISEWNVRQLDLPFTRDALWISGSEDSELTELQTNWGLACLTSRRFGDAKESGYVYIYGDQHQCGKNRQLILARVKPEQIEKFATWEFYAGADGWVKRCNDLVPIAKNIAAEFSIEEVNFEGQKKLLMVHSHHLLGTQIYIRSADRPEGPWSKPQKVYDVPDVKKSKNYFTYAARGHALISPKGQLLITYVVNSTDFWEMAGDASIYRPRCITVSLSTIFSRGK